MLKIKDNVDLKVLENYGFSKKENIYTKTLDETFFDCIEIRVYLIDKSIEIKLEIQNDSYYYATNCIELDIIYDLIQAGLVEKVEVTNNE